MMHAATCYTPPLAALRSRLEQGPATTFELAELINSPCTSTFISELRHLLKHENISIDCIYQGRTEAGRKIYQYELIKE